MPFYFALTTFRVLSLSLIIVSLPYIFIFLYALLVLGIVILGFKKVSNEEGFIARGFRSIVTTGNITDARQCVNGCNQNVSVDDRYHAERVFQIYWLIANTISLAMGAANVNLNTSDIFTSEAVKKNIAMFNGALYFCLLLGPLSWVLFWFQRREKFNEVVSEDERENSEEVQVRLFERVLEDIKLGKRPKVHVFVRLANIFALIVDYSKIILHVRDLIRDRSDPVWGGLLILFPFLPGVAWYSHSDLVGPQNRLTWFLASLFFPGFVTWTRVSLFSQSNSANIISFSAMLWIEGATH